MRRKLICAILCVSLLLLLMPGITVSAADNSIVRVKLSLGTPTSVRVFLDGNYSVGGTPLERQTYTVKLENGTLENGTLNMYLGGTVVASGNPIYITRNADTPGLNNFMWLRNPHYNNDYIRYLGDMCFSIDGSSIQVVNYVYLEHYLYGVVPYEMNDSWPIEALKAQAIAARNYAAKRAGSSRSYDLTDDSSYDQVYRGYNPAYSNAINAVNATAGQVLTSGGAIIDAYYSASNGGWTDLPYHRWGGGGDWTYYRIDRDDYDLANPSSQFETIYFPSVIDAAHPIYTASNLKVIPDWTKAEAYIRQEIFNSAKLQNAGYGVTDANSFTLTGVTNLVANTPETTYKSDGSISQDHTRMPFNGVNDCKDLIKATGDFTVSVGGTPVAVTDVELDLRYLDGSNGVSTYDAFYSDSLGIFAVDPYTATDGSTGFAISQRRYGHGCGLSQRGAEQRAKSGIGYADILAFYYPGTTLETLPVAEPGRAALTSVSNYNATVINDVNVRNGPGTNHNVLDGSELPPGMRVYVTVPFYTPEWHQINYGGTLAYLHKDYVALDNVMFSGVYNIDRANRVITVPEQTDAAQLVAGIGCLGGTVAVYDQSGNPYPSGIVASDMIVRLIVNGSVADELRIVVGNAAPPSPPIRYGDVNSDGVINVADYTMVRVHMLSIRILSDAERPPADVDRNGVIDINDYTLIRLHILGLKSIG